MIDRVVEEVHAARRKICEECGYDFQKMGERFMRLQERHPERLVTNVPKRKPPTTDAK